MNKDETISKSQEFLEIVNSQLACLMYFSTNSCSVGEALDVKVQLLLKNHFPKMTFHYIDINASPELAASMNAFVEPTILIFFDGKESIRKSRNVGVFELQNAIERPYKLIFDNSL